MVRIFEKPQKITLEKSAFYSYFQIILIVAAAMHTFLSVWFWVHFVPVLALYHTVLVLVTGLAWFLNRNEAFLIALIFVSVDLAGYTALSTLFIGWSAGFYLRLLLLPLLWFLLYRGTYYIVIPATLFTAMAFYGAYTISNLRLPIIPPVFWFNRGTLIFNIVHFFSMLVFLAYSFIPTKHLKGMPTSDHDKKLLDRYKRFVPAAALDRIDKNLSFHPHQVTLGSVINIDIAGFLETAGQLPSKRVIMDMNEVFTELDELAQQYQCLRVKTIGDGYLAITRFDREIGSSAYHAGHFALAAKQKLESYRGGSMDSYSKFRIGISTGPFTVGFVGKSPVNFDVYGTTVNTAFFVESTSPLNTIQACEDTYNAEKGRFNFSLRGELNIKGRGILPVYYLHNGK